MEFSKPPRPPPLHHHHLLFSPLPSLGEIPKPQLFLTWESSISARAASFCSSVQSLSILPPAPRLKRSGGGGHNGCQTHVDDSECGQCCESREAYKVNTGHNDWPRITGVVKEKRNGREREREGTVHLGFSEWPRG